MRFKIGDRVRVKADVEEPEYGWGQVKKGETGVITSRGPTVFLLDIDYEIDFPSHKRWTGAVQDLELVDGLDILTCKDRKFYAFGEDMCIQEYECNRQLCKEDNLKLSLAGKTIRMDFKVSGTVPGYASLYDFFTENIRRPQLGMRVEHSPAICNISEYNKEYEANPMNYIEAHKTIDEFKPENLAAGKAIIEENRKKFEQEQASKAYKILIDRKEELERTVKGINEELAEINASLAKFK